MDKDTPAFQAAWSGRCSLEDLHRKRWGVSNTSGKEKQITPANKNAGRIGVEP